MTRLLTLVAALGTWSILAQSVAEDEKPARIAGEISGERVSHQDKQSDWPSIAYSPKGTLFAAYIQWDDKAADQGVVRRRTPDGVWAEPVRLDDNNWDHYSPALVSQPEGVLAVWPAQVDGDFELFSATVSDEGETSAPQRLTPSKAL